MGGEAPLHNVVGPSSIRAQFPGVRARTPDPYQPSSGRGPMPQKLGLPRPHSEPA